MFPGEAIIIIAAAILVLWAAWQDFLTWKIRNTTVLALIAVYAILVLARFWFVSANAEELAFMRSGAIGDLGAGLLLFIVGFVLWVVRLMGAGDAKLFFPIGLFVGIDHMLQFAIVLAIAALVVTMILKVRIPIQYHIYPYVARLDEIRSTGKVPYGVVIALAALVAMYSRYFTG